MMRAFRRMNSALKLATTLTDVVSMDSMRRIWLAGIAGAALAAAPALAADGTSTTGTTTPTGTAPTTTTPAPTPKPKAFFTKLSNRTTFTNWAYTNLPLKVEAQ